LSSLLFRGIGIRIGFKGGPWQKITKTKQRARSVAQVVVGLPRKCKALSSNSSTTKIIIIIILYHWKRT
jgi:hypothetical protein